jgi:hypothetical protein
MSLVMAIMPSAEPVIKLDLQGAASLCKTRQFGYKTRHLKWRFCAEGASLNRTADGEVQKACQAPEWHNSIKPIEIASAD